MPFRTAVEAGLPAVMVGHLDVRAVDPRVPSSLSRKVVTDLLRTELGFEGLVVTDSLAMAAVTRGRDAGAYCRPGTPCGFRRAAHAAVAGCRPRSGRPCGALRRAGAASAGAVRGAPGRAPDPLGRPEGEARRLGARRLEPAVRCCCHGHQWRVLGPPGRECRPRLRGSGCGRDLRCGCPGGGDHRPGSSFATRSADRGEAAARASEEGAEEGLSSAPGGVAGGGGRVGSVASRCGPLARTPACRSAPGSASPASGTRRSTARWPSPPTARGCSVG